MKLTGKLKDNVEEKKKLTLFGDRNRARITKFAGVAEW